MAGKFTFIMVKPAAFANSKLGEILTMITNSEFRIAALKLVVLRRRQAESFYEVHKNRAFYNDLVEFMISGPIVAAVLEKENAVEDYRKLMGNTDPAKAEEGTIRKLYATDIQRNAVHGSDSDINARREITFFFSRTEIFKSDGYMVENYCNCG